jgi:hypothetical protein
MATAHQYQPGTRVPSITWPWRRRTSASATPASPGSIGFVIAVAAILFGLGVAALTGWIIFGGLHQVKVNEALLGPRGAGLIIGFVWLLVGGTLALAFVLQAVGAAYPATISTSACAVALVIGGPALMRRLRQSMERRAAGAR